MHALSRTAFFFLQPSHLALLLLAVGLLLLVLTRAVRTGRVFALTGFLSLLVIGFSPLGHFLILPLEDRFPRPATPPTDIKGVIILGGFEDGTISHARGVLTLNEAAERLTESVVLSRLLPEARIIFTGGNGEVFRQGHSGARPVGDYLAAAGVAPDRIVLESESRNTYENAVLTREMIKPQPSERWLLVTSASHMPRAMATFRHAGFDVVAWPVDYRTRGAQELTQPFNSLGEGIRRVDTATREWLGILTYWLVGRTDTLWLGP